MEQKELRQMSRSELIEIIYELELQNQELKEELGAAREELKDRTIMIEEAGSIAEAALKVNHVFESAQKAVDDYVNSMKLFTVNQCERIMLSKLRQQDKLKESEATNGTGKETPGYNSKDGAGKAGKGTTA